MVKRNGLLIAALGSLISLAGPSSAQDKSALRNEAKTEAAKMRSAGEPKDRCSLEARFGPTGIITAVSALSPLHLGDKLLTVNGVDVKGQTDKVVELLRGITPGTTIELRVERTGNDTDLTHTCGNARQQSDAIAAGLEAAARGNFEDCAAHFGSREDLATYGAQWQLRCLESSKKPDARELARVAFKMLQLGAGEAMWEPQLREPIISAMRAAKGPITTHMGADRFESIVRTVGRWPGGEDMYKSSEPNRAQFRVVAERAVRSRLIDPDSGRIDFPYDFSYGSWKPAFQKPIDGYWTCGHVNAKNRMGGYTGTVPFVVVLSESGAVRFLQLGTNSEYDVLTIQCNKSAQHLSAMPVDVREPETIMAVPTQLSLGDELKKLVELRDSGVLTEEEFVTAKQRLLNQ